MTNPDLDENGEDPTPDADPPVAFEPTAEDYKNVTASNPSGE